MIPLGDDRKLRRKPVVVWLLVGLCVLVYLLLQRLPPELRQEVLYRYGLVPARYPIADWRGWFQLPPEAFLPLLTNLFLHATPFHLLFNLWLLVIFGDDVEDLLGPWRFLLLFLLCGLFANLTHLRTHPGLPLPAVGASGAISGILAAYMVLFPRVHVRVLLFPLPLVASLPAISALGIWVVLQLLEALLSSSYATSWMGHVAGLAAGFVLTPLLAGGLKREEASEEDGP